MSRAVTLAVCVGVAAVVVGAGALVIQASDSHGRTSHVARCERYRSTLVVTLADPLDKTAVSGVLSSGDRQEIERSRATYQSAYNESLSASAAVTTHNAAPRTTTKPGASLGDVLANASANTPQEDTGPTQRAALLKNWQTWVTGVEIPQALARQTCG